MSSDGNKSVVRRYYEDVLTGGNVEVLDEIATADYHDFGYVKAGFPVGIATFRVHVERFLEAFADVVVKVDDLIADGDQVVAIWTVSGIHRTRWWGIDPTGTRVTTTNVGLFRIRDGKIAEYRAFTDRMAFYEQVGANVVAPLTSGG